MAILSQEAIAVIARFRNDPGVTEEHVRNLHAAVTGSPVLAEQFNQAVASGAVKDIDVLTNANAGAEYDATKLAIRVPLARLDNPQGRFDRAEITFAMGHEIRHGLSGASTAQVWESFKQDVISRAQSSGTVHDYTDIVRGRLNAHRTGESLSHLGGWNALASMVKQINPKATLADVYSALPGRTDDFVIVDVRDVPRKVSGKEGFSFSGLMLADSRQNIEAVGRYWYENVPPGLGASGTSDYPNYFARSVISQIVQAERYYNPPATGVHQPVIALNMSSLGLSEKRLEEAGLDFGRNPAQMSYLDTSSNPPITRFFQHTKGMLKHVEPIPESAPYAAVKPESGEGPRHLLHDQADKLVRQMDREMGRASDRNSECLAASVACLAKQHGLDRIDHVVLSEGAPGKGAGQTVFVVQGELRDPAHLRAQMPTQRALDTPLESSMQELVRLESANRQVRESAETMARDHSIAPTRGMG